MSLLPLREDSHCSFYRKAWQEYEARAFEAARDSLLRSVDHDVDNGAAWALLSVVYERMGEISHAAEAARQAVRSEKSSARWHALRGVQVLADGRAQEARDALEHAVTLDATCAEAWLRLADARAANGGTGGHVQTALNMALHLDPSLEGLARSMPRLADLI